MDLAKDLDSYKARFEKNPYPSYKDRKELLQQINQIIVSNCSLLEEKISKDYGFRSSFDSVMMDILPSSLYSKYLIKNLKKWMKKEKRHSSMVNFFSKLELHYQPLGVVGVVVPWNFPLYLALGPALTALAAGNKVMVKMSEFTPHLNSCLQEIFMPLEADIKFYTGDVTVASQFSSLPFDHLLFTGSTSVGRIVAQAAAKNLTPVTLELGGKSPAIVSQHASLDLAIDSILMGKVFNSGQICVAPDYLFIHKSLVEVFIEKFKTKSSQYISSRGDDQFTNIINEQHFKRLQSLIDDAKEKGAEVIESAVSSGTKKFPTLINKPTDQMKVMQEEIFGPLLPILTYHDLKEVYAYLASKPKPLALYFFSQNKKEIKEMIQSTHSGGMCINDTVMHVACEDAPFGGIGDSGMGHYHGKEGFLSFSKAKTVLKSPSFFSKNNLILKYQDQILKLVKKFLLK